MHGSWIECENFEKWITIQSIYENEWQQQVAFIKQMSISCISAEMSLFLCWIESSIRCVLFAPMTEYTYGMVQMNIIAPNVRLDTAHVDEDDDEYQSKTIWRLWRTTMNSKYRNNHETTLLEKWVRLMLKLKKKLCGKRDWNTPLYFHRDTAETAAHDTWNKLGSYFSDIIKMRWGPNWIEDNAIWNLNWCMKSTSAAATAQYSDGSDGKKCRVHKNK